MLWSQPLKLSSEGSTIMAPESGYWKDTHGAYMCGFDVCDSVKVIPAPFRMKDGSTVVKQQFFSKACISKDYGSSEVGGAVYSLSKEMISTEQTVMSGPKRSI